MSFDVLPGEDKAKAELRRWNTPRRLGGMRPDGFEEFPKMLYRARRPETGGPIAVINPFNEQWSEQNCLTVRSREEEERAIGNGQGWRHTPQEAIDYANALETEVSNAAAARQNAELRMSEKARAEAAAVDESNYEHVPEITPGAVKEAKRRGRPPKVA
jgi:hypothetical protein